MRFLPQTKLAWDRFVLFPFKVYVAVAWPMALGNAHIGRVQPRALPFDFLWLGYHVCFWFLLGGGLVLLLRGRGRDTVSAFFFAALALFVLLPFRIL